MIQYFLLVRQNKLALLKNKSVFPNAIKLHIQGTKRIFIFVLDFSDKKIFFQS